MKSQAIEWLLEEKYNGKKTDRFFADCKKLALGEPLAYLIGHSPFLDCKIYLDSHPLIPRPETEYWVEKAIHTITSNVASNTRVLDLCAGSGCIGVAVAKALPQVKVDFSEIDESHIKTITKNISSNTLNADNYQVAHTSLFEAFPKTKYDFILSNPPYIDATLNRADKSVVDHEPYLALFGGTDGMEIISKIIEEAPLHLNPGGQLWIEHEPEQSGMIRTTGSQNSFSVRTHSDQYKIERYSILVLQ